MKKNIEKTNNLKELFEKVLDNKESLSQNTKKGNFDRMCHDAPINRFIVRWSN